MTVQRPAWLQNVGNVYTAEEMRRVNKFLANRRSGVNGVGDYLVSQNGTPNMSVNVAGGEALVNGSETLQQAMYDLYNDAVVNRTIAASDATNPRNDLVVARVRDQFYSGTFNDGDAFVVPGTPAPAPVDPTPPANYEMLARVRVNANATSITNANITDLRVWQAQRLFPGPKGLHVRDSTDARDNLYVDDNGYLFTQGAISVPPSFGGTLPPSSYGTVPVKLDERSLGAPAASVLFPASGSLPTGFRKLVLDWRSRSDQAGFQAVLMQLNSDVAGNYFSSWGEATGVAISSFQSLGATAATVGYIPAAASANWGIGKIEFSDPFNATLMKLFLLQWMRVDGGGSGQFLNDFGGGEWTNTTQAIANILLKPQAGLFIAGSLFTLWGFP